MKALGTSQDSSRYLSALISQTLVAYTLEFDNEFERRMHEAGYAGMMLSLGVWLNLVQLVTEGDITVRELAARALAPENAIKFQLGCLERWGFVVLRGAADEPVKTGKRTKSGRVLREGWGSGRGIRADWRVALTKKGRAASEVWNSMSGEIEGRWAKRFGADQIEDLQQALWAVVSQLELELPPGLPPYWNVEHSYGKLRDRRTKRDALPVLLSRLLLAFTIEFEGESRLPLRLCANVLRVLGEEGVPTAEIPRLTGCSPETSDVGWEAKAYVTVEANPKAKRGKVARLTPRGLKAQRAYDVLNREIEKRWEARFGREAIRRIRRGLEGLFAARRGGQLAIVQGLVPAEGTIRAGAQAPALGRRDVGAAARQRMRDLVAQTVMFLQDPVNALPHYPMWDMNRGFGP